MKPYMVWLEIQAPDLQSAVKYAQQAFGINAVEAVIQKHRMTNYGTQWFRSGNSENHSKNKSESQTENLK